MPPRASGCCSAKYLSPAAAAGAKGRALWQLLPRRAQHPPHPTANATIGHPATGRAALSIESAASSLLGLLTAILLVHQQRASARITVIAGASPLGEA